MSGCPDGFWCFQLKDLVNTLILISTIFAIYIGPVKAVKISMENDERRKKINKERDILSNLMKTRRMVLDPLHVASLNLVEMEFSNSPEITEAYRKYIQTLYLKVKDGMPQDDVDQIIKQRSSAFFGLVQSIGKRLGYSFDKQDLQDFSYSPEGWQVVESEQHAFRKLAIEVLSGKRPFPVTQFQVSKVNKKFPPPP